MSQVIKFVEDGSMKIVNDNLIQRVRPCELRDSHGQTGGNCDFAGVEDAPECESCEETILVVAYYDGHNQQHLLAQEYLDAPAQVEILSEDEVAPILAAFDEAEANHWTKEETGRSCNNGQYEFSESFWQGDWGTEVNEIYKICHVCDKKIPDGDATEVGTVYLCPTCRDDPDRDDGVVSGP